MQDPNESLPGMSILRRPVEASPEDLPGLATLRRPVPATEEELQQWEGGGLKAPGTYTGTWWKDFLPSLLDPGFWMQPEVLGSMALTIPLQKLIPGRAAIKAPGSVEPPLPREPLVQTPTPVEPITPKITEPGLPTAAPTPQRPPNIAEVPTSELTLNPERFQYKVQHTAEGTTGSLTGVQKFDPNLAGLIQVWRDPADGITYVVNGHNRVALARRAGQPNMAVRYLDVPTAEQARTVGALTNIAEGRGTPIDAAKLFRDTGIKQADLEALGIPLREKMATEGLALANLAPDLFQQVTQGILPVERSVIIGSRIPNPDQQHKLLTMLNTRTRVSNDVVRELADFVRDSPTARTVEDTLFGPEESLVSLALDKASLTAFIRDRLSRDKRLFGLVGKSGAAQELSRAGNVINVEESQRVSQEAAQLLDVFDRLKNSQGPIGDLLNAATTRIQQGERSGPVREQLYHDITAALPKALGRRESAGVTRATTGIGTGEPPPSLDFSTPGE